ncbi:MAG: sensor histidine kinase [Solirubrobacteraceae bacterium]|nr:sensor histidine kinase [Solirubrobacteraceae bacterium]
MPPHPSQPTAPAVPMSVRWLPAVFRPTFEELLPRTRVERTRRDWVVDFVLIGLSIAFGIAAHHSEMTDKAPLSSLHSTADLVLLPLAALALLWRRRWPLRVTIFVGLATIVSPSSGFATLVAAFAIAAYSAPTVALGGLLFLIAITPISSLLARDPGNAWWSEALFGVIVTVGVGAWGMFTGTRRQLLVTLHERARRAESEQGLRVEQARQQERTRIAREMHDVLAHRMSLLSVHAGALEFRPDAPAEDVARAAGVIRQTAHEALEELRTVIGVLRVDELTADGDGEGAQAQPEPPQPTLAAVPRLVADWKQAGARVELDLAIDTEAVPTAVGRTAYRVVQEGLTNASKHAPATRVEVHLSGAPGDALVVEVRNALPVGGASTASGIPGTGLGLIGLRERTELAGGGFLATADSAARQFVLRATLPWSAA